MAKSGSTPKLNIVVDSKLHIPIRSIDFDHIQKKFTHYEFENSVCNKCEFRSERPSEECHQCSSGGLIEIVSLSSITERNGKQCIAIPYGEQFNLPTLTGVPLKKLKIIDKTCKKPFDYKIKFTGELRDYQGPAVEDMIDAVSGLLVSKPRTGKCVAGESIVDTSFGQVSMARLWERYGDNSSESVEVSGLTIQTPVGIEPVSWIHRKKSKMVRLRTHIGHTLKGTPEHPVMVVTPDLKYVWKRMDELRTGDWLISVPKSSMIRQDLISLTEAFSLGNNLAKSIKGLQGIPEDILRSGQDVHKAFLRGYISNSEYTTYGIYLNAASSILSNQLCVMLLSIGVTSKVTVWGSKHILTITGAAYRTLVDTVGLDTPDRIGPKAPKYDIMDRVPMLNKHASIRKGGTYLQRSYLSKINRSTLDNNANAFVGSAETLYFHEIVGLNSEPEQYVYDLTVEGSHSFLADGFAVHNTVMATAAAIEGGYRTVFIADQKDFLEGFEETISALTNLDELEEIHGKKLYGFPKTIKDYENFQILLVTYQSLIQDTKVAKSRMKAIQDNYGTCCVDETHRANAACFSSVMANMHSYYRWGLTATPKRKDGKHYIIRSVIGPVVAKTDAEALKADYTVHKTSNKVKSRNQFKGKAGWVRFCQFLAKHPQRNDRIIEWLIRDLEQGRSIAVPVMFTDHAHLIVNAINDHFGEEVAATFLGGGKEAKKRKSTVDRARKGEIRCIVGIRRLIQIGINIPQWDTLYYIMPMNNEPNWEQESFRILTPLENKLTPLCRLFVDLNMERSVQCFRAVCKFSDKLGHNKAKRTPTKLRNWLGVVDKEAIYDDDIPDYVDQTSTQGYRSLGSRSF